MSALDDWVIDFKELFPYFVPIMNGSTDVTDDTIKKYLTLAEDMLPQGAVEYMSRTTLANLLFFTTAHLLTYFNVKDGYSDQATLLKNATSLNANGLGIGYESVAALKGDMFTSLNDFLNTTSYGRMASTWLEKMSGPIGGLIV